MSTIDISLLSSVSVIIVFMLFFVGGWGLMSMVDPFKGKSKGFYGVLAFLVAVLMVMTPAAVKTVMIATPWLVILGMIGFFFIFFSMMFGAESGIASAFKGQGIWWLVTFLVIIMLFALGNAFGPSLLPATAGQNSNTPQPTYDANGNPVYPVDSSIGINGSGGTVSPDSGGTTASTDYGNNLVLTLFNPKILGVLFLFLLGTLTILLLNNT